MPVEILITSEKFYNEFKNDVGFVSNLGDYTNNLAGGVMENIQIVREINLQWYFEATAGNSISIRPLGGGLSEIESSVNSYNFRNDGLAVGDLCTIIWTDNGGPGNAEDFRIQSMTNGKIIAQQVAGVLPDSSLNGFINESVYLRGKEPQTALIYKFGLIGNNESYNIESKVSKNDQGYYGSNIGFDTGGGVRDTNFVPLTKLGQYSDWVTGNAKARYMNNPTIWTQKFEIVHELTIVPYYLDGEITNLQNNIIPNLLNGINTLKYVFSPEFRTVLSNPNTAKNIIIENNLGSVAWFNENFNGFANNYQINSITYQDANTLSSADGLLIGTKTRVSIQVQKNNGNFVVGERTGVYVSYLPDEVEYEDTVLSNLKQNFLYDNALGNSGGGGFVGQDFISNYNIFSSTSNLMTMQFDVEYSGTQKAFLSSKLQSQPTYFLIGVELGDNTLPSGNSDRIILLSDVELYDESADIPDLMDFDSFNIYPHNEQIGAGGFYTDMTSWNEDGLVIEFDFWIDLNKSTVINSLDFKLVAYNPTTGQYFDLDSYAYGVQQAIISAGIQQLIENNTRGYILKLGDQFNDVTITVGANVGGIQHYTGVFAQKISWQEWINNLSADTVFFNSAEPNNNLNYKSSNYSLLNGYEIRLAVYSNLDGVNVFNVAGNTNYLFVSPTITVYDYDTDGVTPPPVWSCLIETFNASNNAPLSGAILTGQDTLFRATWTNKNGAVASLLGLWGINRIEETDEQGYQITEMSSLNDPATNQMLIPNSGTKLFVYLNAGNVVFECLIDGSLVASGIGYNLSSRIHDGNIAEGKLTSPDNSIKDTSGTVETKIEAP